MLHKIEVTYNIYMDCRNHFHSALYTSGSRGMHGRRWIGNPNGLLLGKIFEIDRPPFKILASPLR
jgi:hypothetical protein